MRLLIHCGLHKTGSTALQSALALMAPQLAENGVAYPSYEAGTPFAHHWLANALKGPHVFKKARVNIAEMIVTAQAQSPHTVCLSSEDFETYLRRERALGRLLRIARRLDAQPVFLVYLRNQVEYLESLYLQFLRMGMRMDAADMVDQVVETGQFAWRKWVIQFDYAAMIDALDATQSDVIVRDYHDLQNNCIIEDFLTCIGQPVDLKPKAEKLRRNASRLSRNLERYARNCDSDVDATLLSEIDRKIDGLRPRLSLEAQQKIKDRFFAGNQLLEQRFGLVLNQAFERSKSPDPVPVMDRIFDSTAMEILSGLMPNAQARRSPKRDIELPSDWLAAI